MSFRSILFLTVWTFTPFVVFPQCTTYNTGNSTVDYNTSFCSETSNQTKSGNGTLNLNSGSVLDFSAANFRINRGTVNVYGDLSVDGSLNVTFSTLVIKNGAAVTATSMAVSLGSVVVEDGGSLDVENGLSVNLAALTVENGGSVTASDIATTVGGAITVAGEMTATNTLTVNSGSLTVSDGGLVSATDMGTSYGGDVNINDGGEVNVSNNYYNDFYDDAEAVTTVDGLLTVGGTFYNDTEGVIAGTGVLDGEVADSGSSTFSGTYNGTCTGNCEGVLPVTFIEFKANVMQEGLCRLEWSTGGELNNEGFFVEKMEGMADEFVSIGFVGGHGTTTIKQVYAFSDPSFSGSCYYRLRQVDFDGSEDFSETLFVKTSQELALSIFPNPTFGKVQLAGNEVDECLVSIATLGGKEILAAEANSLDEAASLFTEALQRCQKGMYVLSVSTGQQAYVQSIIKK